MAPTTKQESFVRAIKGISGGVEEGGSPPEIRVDAGYATAASELWFAVRALRTNR